MEGFFLLFLFFMWHGSFRNSANSPWVVYVSNFSVLVHPRTVDNCSLQKLDLKKYFTFLIKCLLWKLLTCEVFSYEGLNYNWNNYLYFEVPTYLLSSDILAIYSFMNYLWSTWEQFENYLKTTCDNLLKNKEVQENFDKQTDETKWNWSLWNESLFG